MRTWLILVAVICAVSAIYHATQGNWTAVIVFGIGALIPVGTEAHRSRSGP